MLGCTVGELLSRTSSRELSEWMVFDHVEGLPDRKMEWLLATLCSTTVGVHWDREQGEPPTAEAFLPWLDVERAEAAPADLAARIVELNALFGGDDLRAGR